MKKLVIMLWAFLFVFCGSAWAAENEFWEYDDIPVGSLHVLGLLDNQGSMEKSLLPDVEKYPEVVSLFTRGGLPAVNRCYYLQDDGHKILIDTGWGSELKTKGHLMKEMAKVGINPIEITDILLTHMDFDHIGGLVKDGKAVFPNATLWVSRPEMEAWASGDIARLDKNGVRDQGAVTLAQNALKVYKDHLKIFEFGQEILPGVRALDASGHTPGHTAYLISSGNEGLLIAGDFIHAGAAQLLRPELSTIYDIDPQKGAQTRENILNKAVEENLVLAGMHLPLISPVKKRQDNGYAMREPR